MSDSDSEIPLDDLLCMLSDVSDDDVITTNPFLKGYIPNATIEQPPSSTLLETISLKGRRLLSSFRTYDLSLFSFH